MARTIVPPLMLLSVLSVMPSAAQGLYVLGGTGATSREPGWSPSDCGPGSRPSPCAPIDPPRTAQVFTTTEWMLTFGADIALRVSPRFAIAPGFRANFARRPMYMTDFDHRGPYSGGGHLWTMGVTARYSLHE